MSDRPVIRPSGSNRARVEVRDGAFVTSLRIPVRAFTILEIVIVLCITVVLLGLAVPVTGSLIRGEQLKAPARELEAMAITARCNSLAEQRPYKIILNRTGFALMKPDGNGKIAEYKIPSGVDFELATWPEEKWGVPKDHIWFFSPSGMCEPIRVMFRKGDSYFAQKYSAITGWDQEETFMIQ